MAELFLKVFTRDAEERLIPFEIDFDDYPKFNAEDERDVAGLEVEIIEFLENHYGE